jgi:NIMA (never in mitosis gene a)-related kinase
MEVNDDYAKTVGACLADFTILNELGKGSYGVIYKVQSKLDNGIYVIKKMELKHMKEKQQKESWKEVMILKKVNHQNLIK